MPCDNNINHLYALSFTVGTEAGLALVAATSDTQAFQILKNSGQRNCCADNYTLIQSRDIGISNACAYGLLMESYVNSLTAYDAIVSVADRFIKGDKGDSLWINMYVDSDLYLHVVESEQAVTPQISFDQSTGYLVIH